jgi:PTS system arbutin-like IIC component
MIAGIKTLDTSIIGAIVISGLVTALHNRYFDKPLPVFLGIFQGSSFVVIVAFLAMIPCAWLTCWAGQKCRWALNRCRPSYALPGRWGVGLYLP